jgi:ubiquinone/menaquinone biosynthesis C-methylase UbiE
MSSDSVFAGSIPELYDLLLVPLIFEPYAADLAHRVQALSPSRVLETAAGTGVATRALARALRVEVELVATDLNEPMLARAAAMGTARPVTWLQADAQQLPFPDASFDVVACQFGVMFFPDKARAFAEVRRVLKPGGTWIFSVWDRIEHNDFAHAVALALAKVYPRNPPGFMARTPHGYHDRATIAADLARGGFGPPTTWEMLAARSTAPSPEGPARAYCQGTPWRNEIEDRAAAGGASLAEATRASAAEIEARYGSGPVDGRIQAHVIAVRK